MAISIYKIGEKVRDFTEQEEQVYHALYKWADRLNKWEYSQQLTRNKGKKLKTYSPNGISLLLIDNMNKIGNILTPEEAMSILHTVEVRTELNLCMQAGF
jgi:ribosomal protein L32E